MVLSCMCWQLTGATCCASCVPAGLLTSLPKAIYQTHTVLLAPNSPAPIDATCTQYISFLLMAFSSLLRYIPNGCMQLEDGDPLAPLLVPAAHLAADALRIYAGPDGARIMASNTYLPGYEDCARNLASALVPERSMTPALMQKLTQQMAQQAGRIACSAVIANALRVADTFSIQAFNGCNYFLGAGGSQALSCTGVGRSVPYCAVFEQGSALWPKTLACPSTSLNQSGLHRCTAVHG
jgi:hypothetical protein